MGNWESLPSTDFGECQGEYCREFNAYELMLWNDLMPESAIEDALNAKADACAKVAGCIFRQPDASRLDAVQGNSEGRTEPYIDVLRGSTGAVDEIMRQESAGFPARLESRADGGGVWNA